MAQHSISYPWSIVSEPASTVIWDIKWLLTNNDSEGQQRGCTEGQCLDGTSAIQHDLSVWFRKTYGVSKAMKVTNQMACLVMAKQAVQPHSVYHTIYIMLQELSSCTVLLGRGSHQCESLSKDAGGWVDITQDLVIFYQNKDCKRRHSFCWGRVG